MNRIITILVTIFILLLLYIWISHVWGSEKPRHPRQIVDAKETQISDELLTDADTMGMPDENVGNDDMSTERIKDPVEEKKAEELMKTQPNPRSEKETKTSVPKNKPTTPPSKPAAPAETSISASGEQHLVIAGNFTQKTNAEKRVKELKKAGFQETEVVNFDLSEYFTVCVGRFSDVNEARRLVKKLKDYHKIDAYVRIGG